MTPADLAILDAVAAQCERMGVDDLRTVPVDDPRALAAAIRAALAAVPPPVETGQREALLERLLRQGMCAHRFTRDDSCIYCGITRRWVGGKDETGYEAWEREAAAALASPAAPERTEALEQRIADLEREHISREDRETAIQAAVSAAVLQSNIAAVEMRVAEARCLLKLEDA